LQAAGVNIHEFKGGLLHAKTITIDKATAMIGSANLDRRSLDLNFEVSMLVYDSDFASQLRFLQSSYMTKSTVLPPHAAADWPLHERLWNNAMGLISPLL
jgi:cardiolipin synthase